MYVGTLLAAMACGLWSRVIYPPLDEYVSAPLPTLRILLAGQGVFIFVVYPLIWLWRIQRGRHWQLGAVVAESAALMFAGLPFYLCAGYLADAAVADGLRCLIYAALLWPWGWAASLWMTRTAARAPAVILGLAATLGAVAWFYIMQEFLPAMPSNWVWHGGVITCAWEVGTSRTATLWPTPTWACLLWPLLGLAALLAALVRSPARKPVR